MSFVAELKRRNVFRVALAYVGISWLAIQVIETLFSIFGISEAMAQTVVIILAIGFVPALIVAWKFELTPEGLRRDADADRAAPGMRALGKRFDRIITIVLVLAVGYFAVDKFVIDPGRDAQLVQVATEQGRIQALVDSYGDKSIAVLPFVNMSSDPEQEYFSDGISEELLNLLAKVDGLRVISRSSAFAFKGKEINVPEVAKALGVAHVLEGSVRRSGKTIRITAQLIEAGSDTHLWSETYDREFDDVFVIQDEIAAKVVNELKITLLGDAPTTRKGNAEVYALYLRAYYLLNLFTDEATEQAGELLKEALRLDPGDVRSLGEMTHVVYRSSPSPEEGRLAVMELVERINEIDPTYDHGWDAWFLLEEDHDLEAGARELEDFMDEDNTNPSKLAGSLMMLSGLGLRDEAVAVSEYVVARDPLCAQCQYQLARAYRLNGRHDDSEAAIRAALTLLPDATGMPLYRDLGRVLLFLDRPEEALEAFDRKPSLQGRVMALHALGRHEEFQSELKLLISEFGASHPGQIAYVYAFIGDNDAAIEWLQKPTEMNKMSQARELDYWVYKDLRDDPRFIAMLEELGVSPAQLEVLNLKIPLPAGVTIN